MNRPRKPVTIGYPTLVEKTLDESVYPSLSQNNAVANNNKELPALPRYVSCPYIIYY